MTFPTKTNTYGVAVGTASSFAPIFEPFDPGPYSTGNGQFKIQQTWVNTITQGIWVLETLQASNGVVTAQWRAIAPIVTSFVAPTSSNYQYPLGQTWVVLPDSGPITNITKAANADVTAPNHGLITGTVVTISGVVGMTQVNGNSYTITVVDNNNFTLGVNSTGYTTYVSGGTWASGGLAYYVLVGVTGTTATWDELTSTTSEGILTINNVSPSGTGNFTIASSANTLTVTPTANGINIDVTQPLSPAYGGTGVNNGTDTITLGGNMTTGGTFSTTGTFSSGGNFSTGGAFSTTPGNSVVLTTTGPTNVTLPTSGTLFSTSGIIPPANGGTGVNNGTDTITLGGNISTGGALTTGGAFTTTPGNSVTLTTTGPTNVTLPTSGTLVSGSSVTVTDHAVYVGTGTPSITAVGPSAVTGAPLISAGSSADPAFSTKFTVVESTNQTTMSAAFAAGNVSINSINTSNTASATATFAAQIAGSTALGAYYNSNINGVAASNWSNGTRGSDGNWYLHQGSGSFGTNPIMKATQGGAITEPLQPAFSAYYTATGSNQTGDGTEVTLGASSTTTVIFDQNSNYNATTGAFTAPVTGIYMFILAVTFNNITTAANSTGSMYIDIRNTTSGALYRGGNLNPASVAENNGAGSVINSALINCTAGDTVTFIASMTTPPGSKIVSILGGTPTGGAATPTRIQGYLVC
jgi:hypothetical protein